ncbi:unnamed protein product [Rhizophagus irregularis]|nr:unnamed protein product [Rhizophagus irregularis]
MKDYKAILQVPCMTNEESSFVAKVEDHLSSEENSYIYKLSKIYGDFIYKCKGKVDMLDCGHTEIDIILKTCSYIIETLNKGFVISAHCKSKFIHEPWWTPKSKKS